MTKEQLRDRVHDLITEVVGVELEQVKDEANFVTDLDADSLDAIELILKAEEEFGVEITDDEAESVKTVGDLVKLLTRKLSLVA